MLHILLMVTHIMWIVKIPHLSDSRILSTQNWSSLEIGSHISKMSISISAPCMSNCIDILARDVVAFHFCQLDDEPTCTVPEFVHNLAAQMSRSPHLLSFRTLLQQSPELLSLLSYHSCLENPSKALIKGILEPLTLLRSQGKISGQRCLILIGK